jgi:predicted Ser/Thr protein kinase
VTETSHVAPPRLVYLGIAVLTVAGVALVTTVGRDAEATRAAQLALGLQAFLAIALAAVHRDSAGPARRALQIALMVAIGALLGVQSWFFGPHSGFAGFLATTMIVVGLLTRGAAVQRPKLVGWSVFAGLAGGQVLVVSLVLAGVLRDASLVPLFLASYRVPHVVFAHATMQGIYLAAFASGRVFQRRYNELTHHLAETIRASAHRDVLLEEARARYVRALGIAKQAMDGDSSGRFSAPPQQVTPPPLPTLEHDVGRVGRAWQEAFRWKTGVFNRAVIAFAFIGVLLLWPVIREPIALYIAWASIAAIVVALLTMRRSTYRAWVVAGLFSVGPPYALGLTAAFPAVITVMLFTGGVFSSAQRDEWRTRRGLALTAVIASHSLIFALVLSGVVPDLGNAPIRPNGQSAFDAVLLHCTTMIVYCATFALSVAIDRRFDVATQQIEVAAREAARKDALLASTQLQLEQVLAGGKRGIFSGQRVGAYDVGDVLGRGSMGEVYEATRSGQRAALKVVRPEVVSDPLTLRLFRDEAEALRRIDSPFVARVFDVSEGELPYIAMEYIDGPSLTTILKARKRLPLDEARTLIREIGHALDDVHRAGVIHRDIKPSNVIHANNSRWKLVDFGVARVLERPDTESFVGTAAYMAPEQALGEPVDARADLYSLCLVIYRVLVGKPAFNQSDPFTVARTAREFGPPDPFDTAPDLPPRLVAVLLRGLSPQPTDRFADARTLAAAFEDAFGSL